MTCPVQFINCDIGLYKIYWKDGGSSLAAIGNTYTGDRWVAPVNWTCPEGGNPGTVMSKIVTWIARMEKIA